MMTRDPVCAIISWPDLTSLYFGPNCDESAVSRRGRAGGRSEDSAVPSVPRVTLISVYRTPLNS